MRTYTHGIIGYLLYLKGTHEQRVMAAIGAMLPDLFLAIGFMFHFLGDSAVVDWLHNVFHRSILHSVTELLHSFVFVVPLLVFCWFFGKRYIPLFVGMFSHIVVDLLTHQRWAYNHFSPFPIAPYRSVFAYTDIWFTIVEHLFVIGFALWMWKRFSTQKKQALSK